MKKALSKQYNKLTGFFSKQEHVKLAYLYGSAAKGKAGKLSDVDIGVLLDDSLNKKERFDLQLKLIGDLAEILKTDKIDLVIMNDVPNSLNFEIIKTKCPLFVRDSMEKTDFEHRVLSRYLDRRYYEKRAASEFLKKVAIKGI
jgi:predicted nucleotidyltransferase